MKGAVVLLLAVVLTGCGTQQPVNPSPLEGNWQIITGSGPTAVTDCLTITYSWVTSYLDACTNPVLMSSVGAMLDDDKTVDMLIEFKNMGSNGESLLIRYRGFMQPDGSIAGTAEATGMVGTTQVIAEQTAFLMTRR